MGFFSASPSKTPHERAPPSADGAYIAPDKSTRARCYEARDRFFACLEANGIVDSVSNEEARTSAEKVCGAEERGLRGECAGSWVTYFKQRRVVEHKKQQQLESLAREGAQKIENELPPINLPQGKPR